jgi:stress responsive alpha/beta barrel protein
MATRIVMVEFFPEVTSEQVAEFKGWLHDLAAHTPKLLRMTCNEHYPSPREASLSANAPNVVFGNFASVWEFSDTPALEQFLAQQDHQKLAAEKFRRVVKRRYVVNLT